MKVYAAFNTLLSPGYHQLLNREVLLLESTIFHLPQTLDACFMKSDVRKSELNRTLIKKREKGIRLTILLQILGMKASAYVP
jgi:hypothetical protein